MSPKIDTRSALFVLLALIVFLVTVGFRPDALPFIPDARFSDAVTSHLPAAQFLRENFIVSESFPVWRDTIMAGQPFAANPLNKTAYPLQWLVLVVPPPIFINVMIVLHLAVAGFGMWRWAHALGLRREAALVSAVAWMLSPRVMVHLGAGHLDIVYALAWLPWVMGGIGVLFTPAPASLVRQTPPALHVIGLGLAAALLVISDVRIALYGLMVAVAYALWLMVGGSRLAPAQSSQRRIGMLIGAAVLTVVLTIGVTVPLIEWSGYLSRAALTQADAGIFSLDAGHLLGVLLPAQQSNPETVTMLGLPGLILAFIGVLSAPRKRWFWVVVIGVAGWYALGANGILWTTLTDAIPALLWFRVPSRAWIIVALVVALLAGYGVEWSVGENGRRIRHPYRVALVILIAAASIAGVFTLIALPVPAAAGWSLIVGAAGIGVVLLWTSQTSPPNPSVWRAGAMILVVIIVIDAVIIGRGWVEWRSADDWFDPYVPLAERLIALEPGRIYAPAYSLPQSVAELYGLRLFGGVDPFQVAAVTDAINAAGGVNDTGYSVVVPPISDITDEDLATANQGARLDVSALATWGVSHVIAPYAIDQDDLMLSGTVSGVNIYTVGEIDRRSAATERVPDWVDINLPDSARVRELNEHTVNLQVFGLGAFALCGAVGVLSLLMRKRK